MKTVYIGTVPVGDGHPTVFVAEVGSFFNKDIELGLEYAAMVAKAGAPVFKTEILHDPDVVLEKYPLEVEFRHAGGIERQSYRSFIEKKVLTFSDYERLVALCENFGIPFIATVFDMEGVDFLVDVKGAAIKISRNNINHVPLIRYAARSGLPVIIDAGEVYFSELAKFLEIVKAEGGPLIINHHPGPNPSPANIHNLQMIRTYKRSFDVPVGLACHYRGEEILYAATGIGANLLEKGVDVDPDRNEADIVSALPFTRLEAVIKKVEECWSAIGDGLPHVAENRDLTIRTGMFARKDIKKDEEFSLENIGFAWPPLGISPEHWYNVDGKRAKDRIAKGDIITWDLISA